MNLFRLYFFLISSVFIFFTCQSPSQTKISVSSKASALLKDGPITGFTLGLHSKDFEYDYGPMLKEIKATGAPWVCLTVKFFQNTNNESFVNIPPIDSPFWSQLERTTIQSKALGLKVLIFPIVLLKHRNKREWRGTLRPMDYDAWYESYESMMTKVAQLSSRTNADMLSVGSEYFSLDRSKLRWLHVIETVKKSYDGALTYSANWDAVDNIQFHDQLDFLGMTGYFNLTKKKNPNVKELIKAWKPIKKTFKKQQNHKNIPFIFTEVGYTSQDGNNMTPWDYTIPNVLDLQEQKDCYSAFKKVWNQDESLHGVFFYDWFGIGGKDDFGYTPKGKPALEVAKKWFQSSSKQK